MPTEPPSVVADQPPQLTDLALQGGGAHGAFTLGVLDRLLEERWRARSYLDIVMVGIVGALVALVAVIVLGGPLGSF